MRTHLFLTFLFLPFASSLNREPLCGILLQATLLHPSEEKCCIHWRSNGAPLTVSITLETKAGSTELYNGLTENLSEGFSCFSFQIPAPSGGYQEVAMVHVKCSGLTEIFEQSNNVLINTNGATNWTFVQTDKPIYKAGDKVKFRILTLNKDFTAGNNVYPIVELQDPNNNRIGQWLDVNPQQGFAQLSYELGKEPILGTYKIMENNGAGYQTFTVEEYVLPKAEASMQLSSQITIEDMSVFARICARYTFGQPMPGLAQLSMCQKGYKYYWANQQVEDLCQMYTGQTDDNGCFSATVPTSAFNLTSYSYQRSIEAKGFVVEDGTGVQVNASQANCMISNQLSNLNFQEMKETFIEGVPYTGKMNLTDAKGAPLPNIALRLQVSNEQNQLEKFYITDDQGMATFVLDTSAWNTSYTYIQAEDTRGNNSYYSWQTIQPYYGRAYFSTTKLYATSESSVTIATVNGAVPCGQDLQVTVKYNISKTDVPPGEKSITFILLVISRGHMVYSGQKTVSIDQDEKETLQSSFTQPFPVADLSPSCRILAYILDASGAVAVDMTSVTVSSCFKNMVSVTFSEAESLPGSEVDLQLQASPGSLCGIRLVDKNVLLQKFEAELTAESIIAGLTPYDYGGYPWNADDPNPCTTSSPTKDSQSSTDVDYGWGRYQPSPYPIYNRDPHSVFKAMGIKVLSNWNSQAPVECYQPRYYYHDFYRAESGPMANAAGPMAEAAGPMANAESADAYSKSQSVQGEQIRSNFPETWIFDLFPVGSSGIETIPERVPDSITEWVASSICIADTGFGLSRTATLTVSKPFFGDMTLPYSVIRGEVFKLMYTCYNYQDYCMMIKMTLAKSADFSVEGCEDCVYTACIFPKKTLTTSWKVKTNILGPINFTVSAEALKTSEQCNGKDTVVPERGQKDTLIKSVRVKPEGVPFEDTRSAFLSVNESSLTEIFDLNFPNDTVEGSTRVEISVVGDIMGPPLQNLENLIQMSSGCGEQNMMQLSVTTYVTKYLKNTKQLTPELEARAKKFVCDGYHTELRYMHADGSYSAFGESDPTGSTWLTIFVASCFYQAKDYDCVDKNVIDKALVWLGQHQNASGCIDSVGQLFHTPMKGGVQDDVSLNCYFIKSVQEMGKTKDDPMVAAGLTCINNALPKVTSDYTRAICAIAYALAGEHDKAKDLLTMLEGTAIKSDGQMHWKYSSQTSESEDYWSQASSNDIEKTGYILQLFMYINDKGDSSKKLQILQWLLKQSNAYGGYASTQDSVVALHALSMYGEQLYTPLADMTVSVAPGDLNFKINNLNRLLVQKGPLDPLHGHYEVIVSGSGSVLFQMVKKYNINPLQNKNDFMLLVNMQQIEREGGARKYLLELETSYVGNRPSSNMALIKVAMLSGIVPVRSTVEKLKENPVVKRTEINDSSVTIFCEELTANTLHLPFEVEEAAAVYDRQPASGEVFDYYEPDKKVTVEYNVPSQ